MLFNTTKKIKIIDKVKIADSFFGQFKGLMLEKKENFDYALIFPLLYESKLAASVHMLFVFFPIEIVFLDSQKKVVDKALLHPWMLNYTPKNPSSYFIEMPLGRAKNIAIGNTLKW